MQSELWKEAVATAPGGIVTAAHVEAVVVETTKRDSAKEWFAVHQTDVYAGMRNRAIAAGHYKAGFKFFELDLLARWLRDNGAWFVVVDSNYGICGTDVKLNGAPEIVVFDDAPNAPGSKGLALWVSGARARKSMSEQESSWVDRMRANGWQCSVNFMAEDALPDLERLGYIRHRITT